MTTYKATIKIHRGCLDIDCGTHSSYKDAECSIVSKLFKDTRLNYTFDTDEDKYHMVKLLQNAYIPSRNDIAINGYDVINSYKHFLLDKLKNGGHYYMSLREIYDMWYGDDIDFAIEILV